MKDIVPPESLLWEHLEATARDFFSRYGYEEIRTPLVEEVGVFTRSVGETSSLVEKEMYTFEDRQGKPLALRPEATASVVRAYIESGRAATDPLARYYYLGPMYRYERPQKGRYRQFYQIGVEAFGTQSPLLDAESIFMLEGYFAAVGMKDFTLEINSLGCPLCRPNFLKVFLKYLRDVSDRLCEDCRRRMEKNPLRVLDCKNPDCGALAEEAPMIADYLCAGCEKDFDTVIETLGRLGSGYKANPRIVRGLDYYTKTTFEISSAALGAQNAVAGGGRYDGLVRLMGGPNIPGFGFAIGVERLVEILQAQGVAPAQHRSPLIFVAPLGEAAMRQGLEIAERLRRQGWRVIGDHEGRSLKALMRQADKWGARHTVILGEDEMKNQTVVVRDMQSKEQETLAWDALTPFLQTRYSLA